MITITKGKADGYVEVSSESMQLARLDYTAFHNGSALLTMHVAAAGNVVTAENELLKIEDKMEESPGLVTIRRKWTVKSPGKWQFAFQVMPGQDYKELILPAIMYGDNVQGEGKFPRGGLEAGWSFREDRMPVPSCALLYNGSSYFALFTSPAADEDEISSIRAYRRAGEAACEIRIPFSEEPYTYCEKGILLGGQRKARYRYFIIKAKDLPFIYERSFYIRKAEYAGSVFRAFAGLTDASFTPSAGQPVLTPDGWGRIASLKLHHLLFLTIDNAKTGIHGVQQGKGNPWFVQFGHENTAGSFLSKSLEGAYIYARAGLELKSQKLMDIAERIGRFFLQGATENGMHKDFYQFKEKKMSSFHLPFDATTPEMWEGANARCNGETMVNYLRLYRTLKEAGRDVPGFRDAAKRNADFYISHQLKGGQEGSFGRWWNKDGEPINTNGTNGAHIIPVLVELEKISGKSYEISRALDSAAKYYGSLIRRNEFYGDTLDADCVDKEAGIILLRAFLDLYERSGEKEYLELARDAACYVLSWTWTYDVPFNSNTIMGKNRFKTKGMTAVSVAMHHIDFYGLNPAYDFLRLWEASGEEYWRGRAMELINCCSQVVSSKDNLLHRSDKYIGWQPEHIYQTDWNYFLLDFGRKGSWDTCIGWEVVLTLGAMLDIRSRFPGILNFSLDPALLRQLDPGVFQ